MPFQLLYNTLTKMTKSLRSQNYPSSINNQFAFLSVDYHIAENAGGPPGRSSQIVSTGSSYSTPSSQRCKFYLPIRANQHLQPLASFLEILSAMLYCKRIKNNAARYRLGGSINLLNRRVN